MGQGFSGVWIWSSYGEKFGKGGASYKDSSKAIKKTEHQFHSIFIDRYQKNCKNMHIFKSPNVFEKRPKMSRCLLPRKDEAMVILSIGYDDIRRKFCVY